MKVHKPQVQILDEFNTNQSSNSKTNGSEHFSQMDTEASVALTPTGVQRPETESLARLISRPDRGRQPTDGCGSPSRCA
jgi:hypothetical protein